MRCKVISSRRAFLGCCLGLSAPALCFGQDATLKDLHQELDRAPPEMIGALSQWNRRVPVEKTALADIIEPGINRFEGQLAAKVVAQHRQLWQNLPATWTPELPALPNTQLFLIALFGENRKEFEKTVSEREQQSKTIHAKLYFTLMVAQSSAQQRQSQIIEPSHVLVAIQRASFSLWPFYCPPAQRDTGAK
jgi:hypothetical protein